MQHACKHKHKSYQICGFMMLVGVRRLHVQTQVPLRVAVGDVAAAEYFCRARRLYATTECTQEGILQHVLELLSAYPPDVLAAAEAADAAVAAETSMAP